ncbi:uncharacterized protein LOC132203818 [Neocloeon triangulifer]|uniref:uncharacterized protein LOC132203818 n=1 Tax=Neocloeon triangulifer TaxID=2078957 RepID=UPI00286F0C73|nr:uncharacterized protein LOC132203818 [Neocloeon triangulifer]
MAKPSLSKELVDKVLQACEARLQPKSTTRLLGEYARQGIFQRILLRKDDGSEQFEFADDFIGTDVNLLPVEIEKVYCVNGCLYFLMIISVLAHDSQNVLRSLTRWSSKLVRAFIEECIGCNGKISKYLDTLRGTMAVRLLQSVLPDEIEVSETLIKGSAARLHPLHCLFKAGLSSALNYIVCPACATVPQPTKIGLIFFDRLAQYMANGFVEKHLEEECAKCAGKLVSLDVINPNGFIVACGASGRPANEDTVDTDFPLHLTLGQRHFYRSALLFVDTLDDGVNLLNSVPSRKMAEVVARFRSDGCGFDVIVFAVAYNG